MQFCSLRRERHVSAAARACLKPHGLRQILISTHSATHGTGEHETAAMLTSISRCAGPDGQYRQDQRNSSGCICRTFHCLGVLPKEWVMSASSCPAAAQRKQVLRFLYSNVHVIFMARLRNCTQMVAVAGSPAITTCSFKHKQLSSTQQSSPVPERLLSLLQ